MSLHMLQPNVEDVHFVAKHFQLFRKNFFSESKMERFRAKQHQVQMAAFSLAPFASEKLANKKL